MTAHSARPHPLRRCPAILPPVLLRAIVEHAPGDASSGATRPATHRVRAGGNGALPGRKVRAEGDPATGDPAADEAYDGLGATYDLWAPAYCRDSLDGECCAGRSTSMPCRPTPADEVRALLDEATQWGNSPRGHRRLPVAGPVGRAGAGRGSRSCRARSPSVLVVQLARPAVSGPPSSRWEDVRHGCRSAGAVRPPAVREGHSGRRTRVGGAAAPRFQRRRVRRRRGRTAE